MVPVKPVHMRAVQIYEFIMSNGWNAVFKEVIYWNRKATVVEKDISEARFREEIFRDANVEFVELHPETFSKRKFVYVFKNRYLKAMHYFGRGYGCHALLRGNEVIGDIWYYAPRESNGLSDHADLHWLGITLGLDSVYSFDIYFLPAERGKNLPAPRTIRHAAARYGGYLPEYEIDAFDHLRMGDIGDVTVNPNDPEETMAKVFQVSDKIYKNSSIPVFLGGDHSFPPEIVRALGENVDGNIGIIHFDSHMDNAKSFGNDKYPRCGPLHRIAQLEKVRKQSIVQTAIRGPRNSPAQVEYAKEMGAKVFTILDIRSRGMDAVIDAAIGLATTGTSCIYVTICSDCIDAASNPR